MEDGKSRKTEIDSFWNIENLVPKRREAVPKKPLKSTDTVEITSDTPEKPKDGAYSDATITIKPCGTENDTKSADRDTVIRRFIPPYTSESEKKTEPEISYSPENSLIHNVRVFEWRTTYNYYEQFCREAKLYYNCDGGECEYIPFFSYVPQYDQLLGEQMEYYLWWRSRVRRGEYPKTDYSYILLYIFEILNLGDDIDVCEGQKQLCGVLSNYGTQYVRIGRLLADWICDYSLINRLPPPPAELVPTGLVTMSSLKEFFINARIDDMRGLAAALIAFCSSYDYKKSKFAVGENRKIYDAFVPLALAEALAAFSDGGKILGGIPYGDSTMKRESFSGALCSYRIKRRIEVDYCSFSRSHELRFLVGDIIKYSENKIRACIGVKSRLGVYSVPTDIQKLIDGLAETMLTRKKKNLPAKEEAQKYDCLYDVKRSPLSISNAAAIELESWETTKSLIEAFNDENAPENTPAVGVTELPMENVSVGDTDVSDAFSEYLDFIGAVLERNYEKQKKAATEMLKMPETVVDEINALSADIIGDILIDGDSGEWFVIDDYKSYFCK